MYKINPAKYSGVTVLPSEIAEKHLKLASAPLLKVIIYSFSQSGNVFDENTISEGTGLDNEEVKDALAYWKDLGFILMCEDEVVFENKNDTVQKTPEITVSAPEKPSKMPHNNPTKLTYDEICTRINESSDIRFLLNEAQLKLGRTIGNSDQSSLILLHDYYGLPVEVVLCICEYARTKGKSTNMNYIYKIGVDWSQREIDTITAADEELKSLERVNLLWSQFCAAVKLPSSNPTVSQEKYLSQWTQEWNFSIPMLSLAFEEMKTHTEKTNYAYMHKVLSAWHTKGINTPEKVVKDQEKFIRDKEAKILEKVSGKKDKTEKKPDPTASYDIAAAEKRARMSVPKSVKKEKR